MQSTDCPIHDPRVPCQGLSRLSRTPSHLSCLTAVDQDPVTKDIRQYWVRQRYDIDGPQEVHAGQGLKVGLYTPTILGGNSYLSWFYDRGAIKDTAHTRTSKGLSWAINRGPIEKFLPKYANVYVTIQSHGLSIGAQTHNVTAMGSVTDYGIDRPSF